MPTKKRALVELIEVFEGYMPDKDVPLHVDCLGSHSGEQNAEYYYLLARLYERLAHHNHLADPPRTTARLLFYESANLYQQAANRAPTELQSFFSGKLSLLSFFLFTFHPSYRPKFLDPSNLRSALASFSVATTRATRPRLRATLSWLRLFTLVLLRRTEAANGVRRALDDALHLLPEQSNNWCLQVASQLETLDAFEHELSAEISKLTEPGLSKPQTDYLEGMGWMMKARLHEELHQHLMSVLRKRSLQSQNPGAILELLEQNQGRMVASSGRFVDTLTKSGFEILRLQLGAQMKRHQADIHFSQCKMEFAAAVHHDSESHAALRERAQTVLFSSQGLALEDEGEPTPSRMLRDVFVKHGYNLSEQAGIAVFTTHAILFDKTKRYRLQQESGVVTVSLASHAAIPFDLEGPQQLYSYFRRTKQAADAYYNAIRDVVDYLRCSASLYSEILSALRRVAADRDAFDLRSLELTLERLRAQAGARTLPVLHLLKDKTTFVWSLLEMFEMRKDAIRLDTLYSGECRLVMENPHEPGTTLEIGADPIFRLAVPLLFRGSRGSDEIRSFLKLLLRSAINTASEQQRCLKREMQYLDPTFSGVEYRELYELYYCHEKLAEGLLRFVDPFLVQIEDLTEEVLSEGEACVRLLYEAQRAFGAAIRFPSPIIGSVGTIEFFLAYVEGVLSGRRGMLFRKMGRPRDRWDAYYDRAKDRLEDAKQALESVESSYLLMSGDKKPEFLAYLSARIATVKAWKLRYLFEDTGHGAHAKSAVALFDHAAEELEKVGDLASATQASARAIETRTLLEFLEESSAREHLYSQLRTSMSLYAICGDVMGFERTRTLILRSFPEREGMTLFAGLHKEEHALAPEYPLIEKPEVAAAFAGTWERLNSFSLGDGELSIPAGFDITLRFLLNFASFQIKNPQLVFKATENECRELLRLALNVYRGLAGEVEIPSARGQIDLVINGVPIEIKRVIGPLPSKKERKFRTQLARYILGEGQRVGVLLVFQFVSGSSDAASMAFSRLVSFHQEGPAAKEADSRDSCFVVQIVIPYFSTVPSGDVPPPSVSRLPSVTEAGREAAMIASKP